MVEILNDTSELNYAYSDNQHIQSLASIIYRAADFAHQCSAENMYEAAYKLSDFCESILDIGVQTGIIFAATALEAAEILTEGVTQGLENSFNYFEKWCTKPKESTIDHLKTAYLLCDTLGAILAAPTEVALFAFEAECQASGQKIACNKHDQISAAIAKHFENKSVKEVLTEIVALGTENIATAKVFTCAGKFLGELGTAIKIEAGPATSAMANKISDAISKIKTTKAPALVSSDPQLIMPSFELIKSKDGLFAPITKIVEQTSEIITKAPNIVTNDSPSFGKFVKLSSELRWLRGNCTFSVEATLEEAEMLAKSWLGYSYRPMSTGDGWVKNIETVDGIMEYTYRFPIRKKNGVHIGKVIANYEQKILIKKLTIETTIFSSLCINQFFS